MPKSPKLREILAATAIALLTLTATHPAQADTLNLSPPLLGPDLPVNGLAIAYTYNTTSEAGTFTASGDYGWLCMKDASSCLTVNEPYHYRLSANISSTGMFLSGTFNILDKNSNSVLGAKLNAFGAGDAGTGSGIFEFTTDQASGWLTTSYPGLRNNLGIIMNATTGIDFVDFSHNFTTSVGAPVYTDHFAVPIPAAVWLFGSGLIGLVAVARRGRGPTGDSLTGDTENH